jgi:hypothetical protein
VQRGCRERIESSSQCFKSSLLLELELGPAKTRYCDICARGHEQNINGPPVKVATSPCDVPPSEYVPTNSPKSLIPLTAVDTLVKGDVNRAEDAVFEHKAMKRCIANSGCVWCAIRATEKKSRVPGRDPR